MKKQPDGEDKIMSGQFSVLPKCYSFYMYGNYFLRSDSYLKMYWVGSLEPNI